MRKNYFAKKFVAYSMAFAVAFSTLTVSPVFVKEAKAANDPEVAYGVLIGSNDGASAKRGLQSFLGLSSYAYPASSYHFPLQRYKKSTLLYHKSIKGAYRSV